MRKAKLKSIGEIPGSVVYTWDKMTAESIVQMIEYNEKEYTEKAISDFHQCIEKHKGNVKWIDFIGVNQTNDLSEIGALFNIHALILEDIANIKQRPKYEDMEDYLFLTLKMFSYIHEEKRLKEEQISFVLGKNYVISFQENEDSDDFENIKDRIRKGKGRIRKMNADYLMYSIVDAIIDNYFVVLEHIEDEVEELQDELMKDPNPKTLHKIQNLKQNLIILRKSIWPVREILGALERTESDLIDDRLQAYLRDAYDHTVQIIDTIETFRDIIAGSLDIYLSSLSNKMNQVMKVLTVISTIFIPLTFIVGVYGMNFKYMPELTMKRTYPALWIIMISIAGWMLRFFRRKKWM